MNNANNPDLIVVNLGTYSTAGDVSLAYLPKKFMLLGAYLINQAIIADVTDMVTLTIKNGSTSLGVLNTAAASQGAVAAHTGKAFAMTAAEQELAAGTSLKLTYAEAGTGTLTLAQVCLYGYWL